MQIK
jgi:hypothetical protein